MSSDFPLKIVILAAGQGKRLRPAGYDGPKVFLEVQGKSILEHQMLELEGIEVDEISIVLGYQAPFYLNHVLEMGIRPFVNPEFETTNMVSSLLQARDILDGSSDILIIYGDIVFEHRLVKDLMASAASIAVTVDLEWRVYWEHRMDDPLMDAERLQMNGRREIIQIGGSAESFDEIEAQYVGLIRLRAEQVPTFIRAAEALSATDPRAYMTELLQTLVDQRVPVVGVPTARGWLEFDSPSDLDVDTSKFWKPQRAGL